MHSHRTDLRSGIAIALSVAAGGCGLESVDLPSLPKSSASLGADTHSTVPSKDSPVDAYALIARSALKCWFGASGSLKATHAFHARVDPPSKGNTAEIVVHTRDLAQPNQAALRAYQITITPSGEGSLVESTNVKFPPAQGAAMTADVGRWVSGNEACGVMGTGGWGTTAPAPSGQASQSKPAAAAKAQK